MKIKSISFQNINSLRQEHTIDFNASPLKEAGLFAITGRTGSGKTTLLDVICLALYNQLPRFDAKSINKNFIERTGSVLTRNTKEAYAEVVYECHSGTYRSRWSISTARTGRLREYEMELSDETDHKLLDLKKSKVPEKNEELMGLNYEQFIRSILLAQGDFARFLKSNRAERGELLEKITGGEIYRRIGKEAYRMKALYAKELEELQSRESTIREGLMSEDEYKETQKAFAGLEKNIRDKEKEQKKLEEASKLKDRIEETQKLLLEAKEREQKEQNKRKEYIDTHGEALERHRKLLPYENDLRNWEQTTEQLRKHQDKKEQVLHELENAKAAEKKAHQAIENFLKKEIPKDDLITELEQFESKVRSLEQEISTLKTEYRSKEESVSQLIRDLKFECTLKDISSVWKEFKEKQQEFDRVKAEFAKQLPGELLNNPTESLSHLRNDMDTITEWISASRQIDDYEKLAGKQKEKVQQYREHLEALPAKIEEAVQKEQKVKLELESLRKDDQINKLTADLEQQRKNLESGKPCPLCGSTHHPYVDEYKPATHDLSSQIREKEKEYSDVLGSLKSLQSEKEQLKKLLSDAEREQKTYQEQTEKMKLEVEKLKDRLGEEYRKEKPEELKRVLQQKHQKLEEWMVVQDHIKKMNDLEPMLQKVEEVIDKGRNKRSELKKLYTGSNIQKDVSKLRTDMNNAVYNLNTAHSEKERWEKEKRELDKSLKETEKRLQPVKDELGYENIASARKQLLSSEKFEALNEKKSAIEAAISAADSEKKTHAKQLEKMKQEDSEKSKEELVDALGVLNEKIREERERRDGLLSQIEFQKKQKTALEGILEKIEQQKHANEKWVMLNHYIGDAEGKQFSTFAQQLTLEQLVHLANKRISKLSDRYILDIPGKDEDESLVVLDKDMGAQRRSVKTLSGGESFLVSLSLALALSDLASRNVEIKSLFIDEGFGSLDQVTLDQTLDTLEKLQAESDKTIGVISHIDALKERMDTQIEVNRDGQGFSSIHIQSAWNKKEA